MNRRSLFVFLALSFGLAWLVTLPLWLSPRGIKHPAATFVLMGMMLTPSIATFVVTRFVEREPALKTATGLVLGRRWGWYWAFAWLAFPAMAIAAPFVGALFGVYELDLVHLSGFRALLAAAPQGGQLLDKLPVHLLVALQLAAVPLAPLLNAPFAFGEEWGWRGYLLPKLLPLGQWPALVLSGAIWGLWHAPAILLGHNYPNRPVLGVGMMVLFCILIGVLLGWTRLATGSVWPAVIAHGAINGSAGVALLFGKEGAAFDPFQAGLTGWSGWLLPALVVLVLVATQRLPVRST